MPLVTLDQYLRLPQHQARDLRKVPFERLWDLTGTAVSNYTDSLDVEPLAVEFYALSQLMAMIQAKRGRYAPLTEPEIEVLHKYTNAIIEQAKPLMAYTAFTCWREQRHRGTTNYSTARWNELRQEYPNAGKVLNLLNDGSPPDSFVSEWKGAAPKGTAFEFAMLLKESFTKLQYAPSYGGLAWARVAQSLVALFEGKVSLEMFVDLGYALAHNNGPIFNKEVVYNDPNREDLMNILHTQRSGQVVQAIIAGDPFKGIDYPAYLKGLSESVFDVLEPEESRFFEKSLVLAEAENWVKGLQAMSAASQSAHIELAKMAQQVQTFAEGGVGNVMVQTEDLAEVEIAVPEGAKFISLYSIMPNQTAIKFNPDSMSMEAM